MRESVSVSVARLPVAFALAAVLVGPASTSNAVTAGVISGPASAVDGDTLDVGGTRVRLEGIDAPEYDQSCPRAWLGSWRCGREAYRSLSRLVADAEVECQSRGTDGYGRMLGVCSVGGKDINAELVRSGLAWAFVKYSRSYVHVEEEARAEGAGIWQSEAEPAWVYRAKRWEGAQQQAPEGCAIKGNITGKGHIYHMPWSPWYAKVRVEPEKGERWFCSESDAMAAGWRPALIN